MDHNIKKVIEYAKHLHVMVVEDDEQMSQQMHELFSELFQSVYTVNSAEEALKLLQKKEFDVTITDIRLPGSSGLELASYIHQVNPFQKIVVISAYKQSDMFRKMLDIGVDAFIPKPFALDVFVGKITKILHEACLIKEGQKHFLVSREIYDTEQEKRLLRNTDIIGEHLTPSRKYFSAKELLEEIRKDKVYASQLASIPYVREEIEYNTGLFFVKDDKASIISHLIELLSRLKNYFCMHEKIAPMIEIVQTTQSVLQLGLDHELDQKRMKVFLEVAYVLEDLSSFVYQVFEKSNAIDVSYLQKSLALSIKDILERVDLDYDEDQVWGNGLNLF